MRWVDARIFLLSYHGWLSEVCNEIFHNGLISTWIMDDHPFANPISSFLIICAPTLWQESAPFFVCGHTHALYNNVTVLNVSF